MPPAAAIGGGALGALAPTALIGTALGGGAQIGTGIAGTISSNRRASEAQRQAEQFFQQALSQGPNVQAIPLQQQQALAGLQQQTLGAAPSFDASTFTPTAVSPEQEAAQIRQLEQASRRRSTEVRSQLGESASRRGLFRSGIAQRQESQALTDIERDLTSNISNLQLGFTRERAGREAEAFRLNQGAQAQAFGLNQASQAQRSGQLQSILGEGARRQQLQQQILQALLGPAQQAFGGAGQAQQQAAQSFQQLGSGFGQIGQTALLASLLGGGGFGG